MRRNLFGFVSLWLSLIAGAWPLVAQNEAVESLSFVKWESLGFSPDGRYFADLVYGVEYSQEQYFARLRILRLASDAGELAFERVLQRSRSQRSLSSGQNALMIRAIGQDLLRREARMLDRFRIEAMESGTIFSVNQSEIRTNMPVLAEDVGQAIYTVTRASNGSPFAVFELQNLRLEQDFGMGGILIGSLRALQVVPRSYDIEQEWSALFRYGPQLNIEPVFISLSPNARHLVVTLRIYREPELADPDEQIVELDSEAENQAPIINVVETNENYDFVSLALRVY